MSQLLTLASALDLTATGPGDPIRLNTTPFAGGFGREALLHLQAAIGGAGVVAIQGHAHPGADAPAEADPGWSTLVNLNSSSPLLQELSDLPAWIRTNVTTVGTGTATIKLEGTP